MEERRDVFKAIADPTRREILTLIAKKKQNLNAIAENFDMSRSAVSQHIKILTDCGLLLIRKSGRERYCEPQLKTLNQVSNWIEEFKATWEDRFNMLETVLSEIQADKESEPLKEIQAKSQTPKTPKTPKKQNNEHKRSGNTSAPNRKTGNHKKNF